MTPEQEKGINELYEKLKQDPLFDLRVEYGRFLIRHINSLSPEERKRYDELTEILTKPQP